MGELTGISWTQKTWNPWIGCTKVSTGPQGACEHCYAERDNGIRHWVDSWGPGMRHRTKTSVDVLKWEAKARAAEERPRVMLGSLCDILDNEVIDEWRDDVWAIVERCTALRFMLITKRIGNAEKMIPLAIRRKPNVGIIATIENQQVWDRDHGKLRDLEVTWRGISAEPLLGPIEMVLDFGNWLDIVIAGGESGPQARPTNPEWFRSLQRQCYRHGIVYHHKQNGEWAAARLHGERTEPDGMRYTRLGIRKTGHLLDGVEYRGFPECLR